MSNGKQLIDMVYVCVVTGQSLPLYEACLTRRPSHIILVVSRWVREKGHAGRLIPLLADALPEAKIFQPDLENDGCELAGDSLEKDSVWAKDVLHPYLKKPEFDGLPRWLNINGGTKLMSLILSTTLPWDRLDYQAVGERVLKASRIEASGGDALAELVLAPDDNGVISASVTPFEVAKLYNPNVKKLPPNLLRAVAESLPVAKSMFKGIKSEQPELLHVLDVLDNVWSKCREDPRYSGKEASLTLDTFLAPESIDSRQARVWLERFEALSPDCFRVSRESVIFPGNHRNLGKRCKAFKKWLSGDWLEQLARHWLEQANLTDEHISENLYVQLAEGESASGRETDLLIQFRGRTCQVEIKADMPPGQTGQQMVQQLGSIHKFGMADKILLIGPKLELRLHKDKAMNSMLQRCMSHNIRLATNQERFVQYVRERRA